MSSGGDLTLYVQLAVTKQSITGKTFKFLREDPVDPFNFCEGLFKLL